MLRPTYIWEFLIVSLKIQIFGDVRKKEKELVSSDISLHIGAVL